MSLDNLVKTGQLQSPAANANQVGQLLEAAARTD